MIVKSMKQHKWLDKLIQAIDLLRNDFGSMEVARIFGEYYKVYAITKVDITQ